MLHSRNILHAHSCIRTYVHGVRSSYSHSHISNKTQRKAQGAKMINSAPVQKRCLHTQSHRASVSLDKPVEVSRSHSILAQSSVTCIRTHTRIRAECSGYRRSLLSTQHARSLHTSAHTCRYTHPQSDIRPYTRSTECGNPVRYRWSPHTSTCTCTCIGVHTSFTDGVRHMSSDLRKVSYAGPNSAKTRRPRDNSQKSRAKGKDGYAWNTKIITGRKSKRMNVVDMTALSFADRARVPIANKIFTGYCEFVASCTAMDHIPKHTGAVEIAVLGRSNVGKSSLLNALMSREKMVKTAKRPGHTKKLNFFRVGPDRKSAETVRLVDMPGHGHASKEEWMDLIGDYLRTGRCALVLVLVSAEHGLKETDKLALRLVAKIRHPATLQTNDKYPHTHAKVGTMTPHPFQTAQRNSEKFSPRGSDLNIESEHATAALGEDDFVYLRTMVVLTKEDKVTATARRRVEMEVNAFLHELNISSAPLSVSANVPIEVLLADFDPTTANDDIISASARERTGIEEARLAIVKKLRLA